MLAALFALLHNLPRPPTPTPATTAAPAAEPDQLAAAQLPAGSVPTSPATSQPAIVTPPVDPARVAAGQRAYARLNCGMCHSIEGEGNPDNPLDGVGARLGRNALYELTTGTGAAGAQLSAGLARRKQRVVGDPELDALLDYLAQLE